MIIKRADSPFKKVGPMKIWEYGINPDFSGALIEIDGEHGAMKNVGEDRIYFIIEGSGTFLMDEIEHPVAANDVIFVPKSTPYNIIGTMRFFLVCSPEFDAKDDISLA